MHRDILRHALQDSPQYHHLMTGTVDVDELFTNYESILRDNADDVVTQHNICRRI